MKYNQTNLLKITLIAGSIFWLVGCGSSKTASSGFDAASTSNNTSSASDSAMAACSTDVAGLSDFQVQVMQYREYNAPNLVRVKIVKAPSEFNSTSSDWKVQMYRWTSTVDGSTSIDNSPLSFQFERKVGTGFELIAKNSQTPVVYSAFYGSQIAPMADYANQYTGYAPISKASPTDFFKGATFLVDLKDSTNSYQVLRVTIHNKDETSVLREVDVLIPTFSADPARYNSESRHPLVLQGLHPLKAKLGQSWSQTQYSEFAKTFCF